MENLTPDANTRNVGGGIVHGASDTLPLFINPSTGELLIEIIPTFSDGSVTDRVNLRIDGNTRNTAGAVTDDSNETIIPLTVVMRNDIPCLRIET